MTEPQKQEGPRCSFCGGFQRERRQLIQGPNVLICNECVSLIVDMIRETEPLFKVHYVTEKLNSKPSL